MGNLPPAALLRLVEMQSGAITFKVSVLICYLIISCSRCVVIFSYFSGPVRFARPTSDGRVLHHGATTCPGLLQGKAAAARVAELLERVGLLPEHALRYPHEFSGGHGNGSVLPVPWPLIQKLLLPTKLSRHWMFRSVGKSLISYLIFQKEFGIAFIFISHDMAVVERISHRVAVMYLGRLSR